MHTLRNRIAPNRGKAFAYNAYPERGYTFAYNSWLKRIQPLVRNTCLRICSLYDFSLSAPPFFKESFDPGEYSFCVVSAFNRSVYRFGIIPSHLKHAV